MHSQLLFENFFLKFLKNFYFRMNLIRLCLHFVLISYKNSRYLTAVSVFLDVAAKFLTTASDHPVFLLYRGHGVESDVQEDIPYSRPEVIHYKMLFP